MGIFHTLLHPLCLSPSLSSTGLEEPWKGKHARTSLVQPQRPLDLSFLADPTAAFSPAGGRDIHLPELGVTEGPTGCPPRVLHTSPCLCSLPIALSRQQSG